MLEIDPGLQPLRGQPGFQELIRDWAGLWIAWAQRTGASTRSELRIVGLAHLKLGEFDEAVLAYERALATAGPDTDATREELEAARAQRARKKAGDGTNR